EGAEARRRRQAFDAVACEAGHEFGPANRGRATQSIHRVVVRPRFAVPESPLRDAASNASVALWLCGKTFFFGSSGLRVFVATVFRGSAARVHPSPGAAFVSSRASASRGSGAGRDRLLAPDPGSRRGRGRFAVLPY